MTNKQFLRQFGHFIDAPNGIQKLREIVLQLAVQGKLVPQDPNDEPAGELLRRIRDNKYEKLSEKVYTKLKKLPTNEIIEVSFDLPDIWAWSILDDITYTVHYGYTASANHNNKDIRLLRITDIQNNQVDWDTVPGCEINEKSYKANSLNENDILIARTGGTIGKTYIVENLTVKAVFASYLIRAVPCEDMNPRYLKIFMETPLYWSQLYAKSAGTGQPNVNATSLRALQVPVPPLAEQHRIVAKVDELMTLCNQLETERNAREATHQRLIRAVHHPLTEAADASVTQTAWHRIRNNFDNLYTTIESVQALRQTILQLAVQGKLVPQDPNDEHASEALDKIKVKKEGLLSIGTGKKEKKSAEIEGSEQPFTLPENWEWTRLQDLTLLITKGSSPKWQGVEYVDKDNGILFITSENVGNYELRLSKLKYVEPKFNKIEPRSILAPGDILMNIVGASIGRTAVFNLEKTVANINQAVCLIRLVDSCRENTLPYLLLFLNSDVGLSFMFGNQVENARANLSMGNIAKFVIPFPPLAEQHRIVAKVEELMSLCDKLEESIRSRNNTASQYAEAVVQRLVAA